MFLQAGTTELSGVLHREKFCYFGLKSAIRNGHALAVGKAQDETSRGFVTLLFIFYFIYKFVKNCIKKVKWVASVTS